MELIKEENKDEFVKVFKENNQKEIQKQEEAYNNLNVSGRSAGSFVRDDKTGASVRRSFSHSIDDHMNMTKSTINNIQKHIFDSQKAMITVGPKNKRFPFDTNEEIFDLSQPNQDCAKVLGVKIKDLDITQEKCQLCKISIKKLKKVVQCEFCAMFGCPDCIYKTLPFPKKDQDASEHAQGLVCMICEAKLHIDTVTSHILHQLHKEERSYARKEKHLEKYFEKSREAQRSKNEEQAKLDEQMASNDEKYE